MKWCVKWCGVVCGIASSSHIGTTLSPPPSHRQHIPGLSIAEPKKNQHHNQAAYNSLLSDFSALEQANQQLQLQLDEAARQRRNTFARTLYANPAATATATTSAASEAPDVFSGRRPSQHPMRQIFRDGGVEFTKSMQHIRVPGLENWSDEFHSLPMLE